MFCENCGKEVKDTDKFCMQCGWRIEQDLANQETLGQEVSGVGEAEVMQTVESVQPVQYVQQESSVQEKKAFKEKKNMSGKSAAIIVAAMAIVMVLAIVVLNIKVLANFAMKTFASPEKYYQYVEKRAFAENAETIATIYENYFLASLDTKDQGVEGEITLNIGDKAIEMAEGMAGLMTGMTDFSWIQNISIQVNGNKASQLCQGEATLVLGEEEIIAGEAIVDMEEGEIYLGLPGLLEDFALIEIPEDSYELEEFKNSLKLMEDLYEKAPDIKAVEKLLYRYFCTAIEAVDNVNKKSEELEVEDISKKYTRLKVTFDEEALLEIAEAVLKEMKSDKELEKIILDVASVQEDIDPEDLYDEFKEEVKYALDEIDTAKDNLENYESDSKCVMLVYVDAKGNICGREFKLQEGSQVEVSMGYKMPEKGKAFGFELYADSADVVVEITGSGERSGDNLSGEFLCTVDDMETVAIEVTEYNTEEIKKGYLNGNFVLKVAEDVSTMADIPNLSEYSMELDVRMTEDARDFKAVVHSGKEDMLTLTSSFKQNKGKNVELPSKSQVIKIEDDNDIMELMEGMDFKALIDSLRNAGLPSEIMDGLDFYLSLM